MRLSSATPPVSISARLRAKCQVFSASSDGSSPASSTDGTKNIMPRDDRAAAVLGCRFAPER
jgi:hypothetical protein